MTFGIWILPEPIMTKASSGEQFALFLIDTQGTLNGYTTEEESVSITALCLLLSSITIYNVKNDIQEENLRLIRKSLNLCSELQQDSYHIQDLLFAVRDFQKDAGFDLEFQSGSKYVDEKLEIKSLYTDDARICRQLIKSSFKNITCILFPSPGEKVKSISHKGFLADMDPIFSTTLESLPYIFDKDKLSDKSFGNGELFFNTLKRFVNLLNERSFKQLTLQQITFCYLKAFEIYKEYFESNQQEFFSTNDVQVFHEAALQKSVSVLEKENSEIAYKEMIDLRSKLNLLVQDYYQNVITESKENEKKMDQVINNAANAVKATYSAKINKLVLLRKKNSEKRFDLKHESLKTESISSFLELIPKKYQPLDFSTRISVLETEIDEIYAEMKITEQTEKYSHLKSNKLGRSAAIDDYKTQMSEIFERQPSLNPIRIKEYHEDITKHVLDKYCNIFDYADFAADFQILLKNELNVIFSSLAKVHEENKIVASGSRHKRGNPLVIPIKNYRKLLAEIYLDMELSEEDIIKKVKKAKDKIVETFLFDIQHEHDQIKLDFSNNLNFELEKEFTKSVESFQLKRLRHLKLTEKITSDMLSFVESCSNSNEGNFVGKPEVFKNVIAISSSGLVDTQNNQVKEIIDFSNNMCSKYAANQGGNLSEFELERDFENCSGLGESETSVEEMGSTESRKNYHITSLKDVHHPSNIKWAMEDKSIDWEDFKIREIYKFQQKNVTISVAEMEATKLYHEAMKKYFSKAKLITPSHLQIYQSLLCTKTSKAISIKFQLDPEEIDRLNILLDKEYEFYKNRNAMNAVPNDDIAIGIDLGTSYTCAAIYENGVAKAIPNERGSSSFPNFVTFMPQGETVGYSVKEMAHICPENTIFDMKRLIGRKFEERAVKAYIAHWPFEVVNEGSVPKIKVQINKEEKVISVERICAKILNHVKAMAEQYLGKKIIKAVITVPTYFNDDQRKATKEAAEIAGLQVLQILNEPAAAALAYHLSTHEVIQQRNVLIYDLGGGTFDVTILLVDPGGQITVKSVYGNTHLGGQNFDENLLEEVIKRYKEQHSVDLKADKNANRIFRRLRNACEMTKINICGGTRTDGIVNVAALVGGRDFLEPITRKQFEDLNMDTFQHTLAVVQKALKDVKLGKGDMHDIFLVGGSTRIPKVKELISEYFEGISLNQTMNPDEVVACGAAIQAAILNGNQDPVLKNIYVTDELFMNTS